MTPTFLAKSIAFLVVLLIFISVAIFYIIMTMHQTPIDHFSISSEDAIIEEETREIPRIIWTYWHDENVPEIVQHFISTWRRHNPSYDVHVVTKSTVPEFLPDVNISSFKHVDNNAHFSDRIRIKLLQTFGGFWMDASMVCTKSLDWIRDIQKSTQCELVLYYLDGFTSEPRYPVVENWFMACVPGASMMKAWDVEMGWMDQFQSRRAYVDYITDGVGVDLQRINQDLREYLSMHLAAQLIFQKRMSEEEIQKQIYFMKAEDGPLQYLANSGWDSNRALVDLCERWDMYKYNGLVKFRKQERDALNEPSFIPCLEKIKH